ncbi:Uncharacterised protein [Vibrio cholerae]|nr:Uncharacterised protein [Vibrio cholerae]
MGVSPSNCNARSGRVITSAARCKVIFALAENPERNVMFSGMSNCPIST